MKPMRKRSWSKWNRLRQAVFRRDNHLCQPCDKSGRVRAAVDVDHIVALDNGGTDAIDNLQSICASCHKLKTLADLGHNVSGACDKHGRPLDPRHPWNATDAG